MVETFGNNIVGAFTGGQSVEAIYAGSVKVWPDSPVPSGQYYIKWWPKDLSGSFTIGGETRWLQDYSGFYSGPFLSSIWFPSAYSPSSGYALDDSAFAGTGVVAIETNLDCLGKHAFESCASLYYVSASKCVFLGRNGGYTTTFQDCTSLKSVYLPLVSFIGGNTFRNCSSLTDVYLPECTTVYEYAFYVCRNLMYVELPKCTVIDNYAFGNCTNLRDVRLPMCQGIGTSAFDNCSNLDTIILGYSGVCSGLGLNATNTKLANGQFSIYVPLEWVSEYKSQYSYWASIINPIPHA